MFKKLKGTLIKKDLKKKATNKAFGAMNSIKKGNETLEKKQIKVLMVLLRA